MRTQCTAKHLGFQDASRRSVHAAFDGGRISSDGGLLLLREVVERSGLLRAFAQCFVDYRNPALIEHTVEDLVAQRVLALACGHEDLNDHDELRDDPLLALAVGKDDLTGQARRRQRDRGHALAGKSTLNRLELTEEDANESERYKKIVCEQAAVDRLLVDVFLSSHREAPQRIVLDVDATDDPLHGNQEGRFFHGYYRSYCYLPLYIFAGDHLLCARLRTSDIDPAAGTVDELARIVGQIRQHWPEVEIVLRGDSGFARDDIMSWCEANGVDYVVGLAKNDRLKAELADELEAVRQQQAETGKPARTFKDFRYRTLKTWSRRRRVVGKAEQLVGKSNPRFVVTSMPKTHVDARTLYEHEYCARGEMENRIKEQQLGLFADRTSTSKLRSNQLRLYFSSVAYLLLDALRRFGLASTAAARWQVDTIRVRLLKLGAVVRTSVRRVVVSLSESFPQQALFGQVNRNIASVPTMLV